MPQQRKPSQNFSRFVTRVATDSDEMEKFKINPEEAMKKAGLTPSERSQLRSHKAILAEIRSKGIRHFIVEMEVELIGITRPNQVWTMAKIRKKPKRKKLKGK